MSYDSIDFDPPSTWILALFVHLEGTHCSDEIFSLGMVSESNLEVPGPLEQSSHVSPAAGTQSTPTVASLVVSVRQHV